MATPAQIEANQKNAQLSTGPTSPDGKVKSSRNSWKHGMAGGGISELEQMTAAFEERRAEWAEVHRAEGGYAAWVLDRVVAASFRIELCERSLDAQVAHAAFRAAKFWDTDRELEALEIMGRVGRSPYQVMRRLEASAQGCGLMIEGWEYLARLLEFVDGWDEGDASYALDLLGVDPDDRLRPTSLVAPEGVDPLDHRRALCLDALARLRALKATLDPVDAAERAQTESGAFGLLTKPARLIERYEREAWRRLRDGMETLRRLAEPSEAPTLAPAPEAVEAPEAVAAVAPTVPAPSPAPARSAVPAKPPAAARSNSAAPAFEYVDFAIIPATAPVG